MRFASNALVTFNLPEPVASKGNLLSYASKTKSVVVKRSDFTCSGLISGFFCNNKAAAPETCGAAKLVPLVMLYFPSIIVELIKAPGATRSGLM